jgi:hypothetical protein
MAEEYRVGIVALGLLAVTAGTITSLGGPAWYAVAPVVVYSAYLVKLKVRRRRDRPGIIMLVLAVVSLAMIGFAVL